MYKISVIIAAYNVEKYIDECFDSLINQTLEDFEIIVVNDGSTDSTRYILEKYSSIMKNMILINQENSGSPGGPRNRGIELASGKYIFILDPDDVLPYRALEVLYNAAEKSRADLTCGNYLRFNSKRAWTPRHISEKFFQEERKINFAENIELLNHGVTWNKLYLTSFIRKHNIKYNEKMKNGEDKPFMLDAYFYANYIYLIPDIVYKYREREDINNKSATQELTLSIFKQSLDAIVDNYKILIKRGCEEYTNGLFTKERVQHDFIRFINFYTTQSYGNKEWDEIFDISSEYLDIISTKINILPYLQRLKIDSFKNRNYNDLIDIYAKERKKYYYSINKKQGEWLIEDPKYIKNNEICKVNISDLILKHKIENINIDNNILNISGFLYFNRVNVTTKDDIKKYIIFKGYNCEKKYELTSIDRKDINSKCGKLIFSYKWSGINFDIDINDLNILTTEEYPNVKIFLQIMLNDELVSNVYINELDIFNYINKKTDKIIQRIDRINLEDNGIKLLGWSSLLYLDNDEKNKFPKKLILKNKLNNSLCKYSAINKKNLWYNERFETNPYNYDYSYSGWECFIPYNKLEVGIYEFYIEIENKDKFISDILQFGSFTLLKNRLTSEQIIINCGKKIKIELTASEYSRQHCKIELFVDTIYKNDSQLLGGYIPLIGKRLMYWNEDDTNFKITIHRIKVMHKEIVIEGNTNQLINSKMLFKFYDKKKDKILTYETNKIDNIYNQNILNAWEVTIPYNQIEYLNNFNIMCEYDNSIIKEFYISNRLKNNNEVWKKTHYINRIRMNINNRIISESDKFSINIDIESSLQNLLKGILIKTKNRLKKYTNKINLYRKIKKQIKKNSNIDYNFIYKVLCILPIKKNKIIMLGYQENINYNFKPIYHGLKEHNNSIDIKYIGGNNKNFIQILSLIYEMATSENILLNDYYRYIYPIDIRNGSKVIQIWHATGIFKKFGLLALGKGDSNKKEFEIRAHKTYTNVIVSSEYVKKPYAEAFGLSIDKVLPLGVARTDMFFDKNYIETTKNNLFKEYPYFKDKKIILYAPTFRGGAVDRKKFRNQLEFNKMKLLKDEGYIILVKLHPAVQEKFVIPVNMTDFVYDMTKYPDINDLFLITDILITDYSSNMFEFALLRKPILLFAYDLDKYLLERGFYDEYEDMVPGPICMSTEEIIENIKKLDINKLDINKCNYEEFINKYLDKCDGHSTERIVNLILNNK